ncbi:hypothetical protein O9G_003816 [Rozella allomycis CSF55]|uniref:Uncharacterized protein n=1 Tax=Rozella allomycis (strain CSF55) TaxID=988480 RepID=A0A075AYK4_ROZAC|nr:hypothetical protein O9G_003816 [Rozella allomycis CSF55]|eukprot:EPZ35405.1 hypothetical protein O9G_003816 [Rozella allomycis CSF55]
MNVSNSNANSNANADAALLHRLFKENNDLRIKIHNFQREDEFRILKKSYDEKSNGKQSSRDITDRPSSGPSSESNSIQKKNAEILKLTQEIDILKDANEQMETTIEQLQVAVKELEKVNLDLKEQAIQREDSPEEERVKRDGANNTQKLLDEMNDLRKKNKENEEFVEHLKAQFKIQMAENNKKNNDLQNQLQGIESLVEGIKREYDEFLEVTKLENEAQRSLQTQEYERLKHDYDIIKSNSLNEKRKILAEFQNLLYTLQSNFEEYKSASEFIFNLEITKLEEELVSQALRFEQEMIYLVQAKDKFYTEMMIAKDAKIMNLVEGSDMQSLIQKHEVDLENLRRDHAREMARIRDERESEQKNLVANLTKNNASLEAKCDKLQSQVKSLEQKIRELVNTIEGKNRTIHEKEESKKRSEEEYQIKLDIANQKIETLAQEKEHLRHKIIRMSMDAKGEGENNMENMLKRITRVFISFMNYKETSDLYIQYEKIMKENKNVEELCATLTKKLKERDRYITFLEREVQRRNDEMSNLSQTFERFLLSRTQQKRLESKLKEAKKSKDPKTENEKNNTLPELKLHLDANPKQEEIPVRVQAKLKFQPPKDIRKLSEGTKIEKRTLSVELEQGFAYLKRFNAISKALNTTNFKRYAILSSIDPENENFNILNVIEEKRKNGEEVKIYAESDNQLGVQEMSSTLTKSLTAMIHDPEKHSNLDIMRPLQHGKVYTPKHIVSPLLHPMNHQSKTPETFLTLKGNKEQSHYLPRLNDSFLSSNTKSHSVQSSRIKSIEYLPDYQNVKDEKPPAYRETVMESLADVVQFPIFELDDLPVGPVHEFVLAFAGSILIPIVSIIVIRVLNRSHAMNLGSISALGTFLMIVSTFQDSLMEYFLQLESYQDIMVLRRNLRLIKLVFFFISFMGYIMTVYGFYTYRHARLYAKQLAQNACDYAA